MGQGSTSYLGEIKWEARKRLRLILSPFSAQNVNARITLQQRTARTFRVNSKRINIAHSAARKFCTKKQRLNKPA